MEHNNIPIDKLDKRFPTVFDLNGSYGNGAPPKTVLELRAMAVSGAIREKKNWIEKLKNNEIKQRWIDELQAEGVTNEVIKYVFDELEQYYSKLQDGLVVPSPADGVYQADGLISEDLRKELIQGVYPLENVDSSKLDWHPGSNEQVLDLVHPSLYCYIIGQTKTHEGIWPAPWSDFLGSGSSERVKKGFFSSIFGRSKQWLQKITTFDYGHKPGVSEKYQWLPAEFDIDKEGKVQIQSYINNLHPEIHAGLYSTLERIFERFIPMFNKTLTEALHQRPNRIKCEYVSYPEGVDEYDPHRIPIQPPLPNFTLPPRPKTRVDLRGRNLQVIVKMANIHLTPDKPEYDGGVWHVEGMDNERIIATGIYYYHTDNITTSKLSFRTSVTTPGYAQDDRIGPPMVFGLAEDAPLVQPVGSVITEQDRCIVFPNLYQHKVESFKLADPTKPGSRKILVFFLVDPGTPIVSTAVVPPQQSEWYKLQLMKQFEGTLFETLPPEMQLEILNKTSEAMSLETAKHHREELMKERKFINDMDNGLVFERPFSLCEH